MNVENENAILELWKFHTGIFYHLAFTLTSLTIPADVAGLDTVCSPARLRGEKLRAACRHTCLCGGAGLVISATSSWAAGLGRF